MSQAPHEPTEDSKTMARTLSGLGVPQDDIATLLGVSKPTLHKHYRKELDKGMAEANAKVAQSLFKQATGGNTGAAIFWMKARANWSERVINEHTGANGAPLPPTVVNVLPATPRTDEAQ